MSGRVEKALFYESRASLINGQETARKQFSPLWEFCEVRSSLVKCQDTSRKLL